MWRLVAVLIWNSFSGREVLAHELSAQSYATIDANPDEYLHGNRPRFSVVPIDTAMPKNQDDFPALSTRMSLASIRATASFAWRSAKVASIFEVATVFD